MISPCIHHRWVRRADEDTGVYCRFRCSVCGTPAKRRFDEPDTAIRPYSDPEKIDRPSWSDVLIGARMRYDRIRGGAYVHIGDCNGNAIYHARGGSL